MRRLPYTGDTRTEFKKQVVRGTEGRCGTTSAERSVSVEGWLGLSPGERATEDAGH